MFPGEASYGECGLVVLGSSVIRLELVESSIELGADNLNVSVLE